MTKEQIKTLRKTLNLTQTQFALKIGYSRVHLSYVELGTRPVGTKLIAAIELLTKIK